MNFSLHEPGDDDPAKYKHCIGAYLYVIESNELFKIGVASSVARRLRNIQMSSPCPVRIRILLELHDLGDARDLEKELHKRFKDKNRRGEWFVLAEEDLAYIWGIGK